MLRSVLMVLDEPENSHVLVEQGVALARRFSAHLSVLTLVDTRHLSALRSQCETAAYAVMEQNRLKQEEPARGELRMCASQACLAAGLDFNLHEGAGDPFQILSLESQFHDVVLLNQSHVDRPNGVGLTVAEKVELIQRGVQPLLILRETSPDPERVLLAYDGSAASGRAIKSFIAQGLYPHAEFRLLALAETVDQARHRLTGIAEYCRKRGIHFESGLMTGPTRRVIPDYADHWEADLVVLGVPRKRPLFRLLGNAADSLLRFTTCALYATS